MKHFFKQIIQFFSRKKLTTIDHKHDFVSISRRWSTADEIVATYCLLHRVEHLGMDLKEVADLIRRTEGALKTKISRLGSSPLLEAPTVANMILLNEYAASKAFYRALITISAELENGMVDCLKARLKAETQYQS